MPLLFHGGFFVCAAVVVVVVYKWVMLLIKVRIMFDCTGRQAGEDRSSGCCCSLVVKIIMKYVKDGREGVVVPQLAHIFYIILLSSGRMVPPPGLSSRDWT